MYYHFTATSLVTVFVTFFVLDNFFTSFGCWSSDSAMHCHILSIINLSLSLRLTANVHISSYRFLLLEKKYFMCVIKYEVDQPLILFLQVSSTSSVCCKYTFPSHSLSFQTKDCSYVGGNVAGLQCTGLQRRGQPHCEAWKNCCPDCYKIYQVAHKIDACHDFLYCMLLTGLHRVAVLWSVFPKQKRMRITLHPWEQNQRLINFIFNYTHKIFFSRSRKR